MKITALATLPPQPTLLKLYRIKVTSTRQTGTIHWLNHEGYPGHAWEAGRFTRAEAEDEIADIRKLYADRDVPCRWAFELVEVAR